MNKKIKVFDLIEMFYRKEKMPQRIKVSCYEFEYDEEVNAYFNFDENSNSHSLIQDWLNNASKLNNEVEILEDNTKIKTGNKVRVRSTTVPKGYSFTYNFGIGSIGKVINVTNYTDCGRNVIVQFENDINKQEWFYEDDLEILEDNTEEIEELPINDEDEKLYSPVILDNRIKINELVRAVKKLRKEEMNNG